MKNLGSNIKTLRRKRRLTLIDVSRETNIDPATLSRIENNKMVGTIQCHLAIAKALHVRLPDLYERALDTEPANDSDTKPAATDIFAHSSGSVSEMLTANILQKKMMPIRLRLRPGSRTETEEFELGTERFIYVITGTIHLVIKEQSRSLGQEESLYFNANSAHHFENSTKQTASCLVISSPPAL